jgi:NADH-quinone oxidoreductase subunit G
LAKGVLGTDNVDCQLGDGLPGEVVLGLPRATIDEVCEPGGTVVVIGPDLKEELPVLFLRLRHAALNDRVRIVEISPQRTSLSELAELSLHPRPGATGELVRALGRGASGGGASGDVAGVAAADLGRAIELLGDGPFDVVLGRGSVAESADATVDAAAGLREHFPDARFLPALRRGNVHGALDMGMGPGLLPGRVGLAEGRDWLADEWTNLPSEEGLDTRGILEAAADGRITTLVLLGADVLGDFPDRDLAERGLAGAANVVALDLFLTETSSRADVVLPTAGFAECDGTTTNLEGRVSLVAQVVTPPGTARSDWMIAADLAFRMGHDLKLESVGAIWSEIERLAPSHHGLSREILDSPLGQDGVVVPVADPVALRESLPQITTSEGTVVHVKYRSRQVDLAAAAARAEATEAGIRAAAADDTDARDAAEAEATEAESAAVEIETEAGDPPAEPPESMAGADRARPATLAFDGAEALTPPPVDAYGLRLVAARKLYDQGERTQRSPALAGLAPGTGLAVNPYDFDRLGVEVGDDVRVTSARTSVEVEITADPGVPRGTGVMYFNQPGVRVADLIDATSVVTDIRVETAGGAG